MAKQRVRYDRMDMMHKELVKQANEVKSNLKDETVISLVDINSIHELKLSNTAIEMHNRITCSKDKLIDLANNIKELSKKGGGILRTGIIHPVMIRKINGELQRIHGYNRIEALKLNGATKVPAIIMDNISDELARFLRTSENLNRDDLNIYDETLSILEHIQIVCDFEDISSVKRFIYKVNNANADKSSLNDYEKEVLKKINMIFNEIGRFNIKTFVDRLAVLKMNTHIKQALVDGYISYTQASVINTKLKNEKYIIKVLDLLKKDSLSVSKLKQYITNMISEDVIKPSKSNTELIEAIKPISNFLSKKNYKKLDTLNKNKVDKELEVIVQAQKNIRSIVGS